MTMLRTAKNKQYPCDFMGTAHGFSLYLKLTIDYQELLNVFQDPNETKILSWIGDNGETVREETGYTKFTGFDVMSGPCPVRVRLEKDYGVISDVS